MALIKASFSFRPIYGLASIKSNSRLNILANNSWCSSYIRFVYLKMISSFLARFPFAQNFFGDVFRSYFARKGDLVSQFYINLACTTHRCIFLFLLDSVEFCVDLDL
jgi:hypothetical protein